MSLLTHVQSFEITPPTGLLFAGSPLQLSAAATEILDIPTVEVLTGQVNLTALFKHVQLPAETGVTPWPPDAAATGAVANISSGLGAAPAAGAIEGWLTSISGTVPVGVQDISDQIRIDVRWKFTDPETKTELTDFAVVAGSLLEPDVTVAFPPVVAEAAAATLEDSLTAAAMERRKIGVQVVVRGRVGTTQDTLDVTIPSSPIVLELATIPLPSVAMLFEHPEFGGSALVMVPDSEPFSEAKQLFAFAQELMEPLNHVHTAAQVAGWATGTGGLVAAVTTLAEAAPTHLGFLAQISHENLGHVNFIPGRFWNHDIEDKGSSLLVLSPTRAISFFQHDEHDGERLTVDARPQGLQRLGGAVLRSLHSGNPASEPPGCVEADPPSGGRGDSISSYRWEPVGGPS